VIFRAAEFDSCGFQSFLFSSQTRREFLFCLCHPFQKYIISHNQQSDKLEKREEFLRRARNEAADFQQHGNN